MARTKLAGITNKKLLQRLGDFSSGGHGAVILLNRADWVDDVIRVAERDGFEPRMTRRSLWSHCLIVAEPYRGDETWTLESTVPAITSAAKALAAAVKMLEGRWGGVRWGHLGEIYSAAKKPNMAVMDFGLGSAQAGLAVRDGDRMERSRTYYPAAGLVGTWAFYVWWSLMRRIGLAVPRNVQNPLTESTPKHLYCSAFVQKCYLAAGRQYDFTGDFAATATSPEHIWRSALPNTSFYVARDP